MLGTSCFSPIAFPPCFSTGFSSATTFKDRKTGWLVGIAVWDDWESMTAARHAMEESTRNDRFEEWEEPEMQSFQLDEA